MSGVEEEKPPRMMTPLKSDRGGTQKTLHWGSNGLGDINVDLIEERKAKGTVLAMIEVLAVCQWVLKS